MRKVSLIVLTGVLCLLWLVPAASAMDYNYWIPLLPDSIDGMNKSGEPEGMNNGSDDDAWSLLKQKYSDGDKRITFAMVSGEEAPFFLQFRKGRKFPYESASKIIRALYVSDYKALYIKKDRRDNSRLALRIDDTLVSLEASPARSEEDMIEMMKNDVPLKEIAEQFQ
ncbi:MAG: hypothetical protein KGY42_06630 [Desulfobacterales bacterium]|nr:hypothetical protein [Desulfobacterales bacterium]